MFSKVKKHKLFMPGSKFMRQMEWNPRFPNKITPLSCLIRTAYDQLLTFFFVAHICSASASGSVCMPWPPVKGEKCKIYIKCSSAREMSGSGLGSANKKWT